MSHGKRAKKMDPLASFIFNTASSALSGIIVNMVNGQTTAVKKKEFEREVARIVREEVKKSDLRPRPQDEELKKVIAEILNEIKRSQSTPRVQESSTRTNSIQRYTVITYSRINLIKSQVRIALRRTTNLDDYTIENCILSEIEGQGISEVNVYGLDYFNRCEAQLIMKIDWDRYKINMDNGKATVVITEDGQKWRDNTAVELKEAIKLFIDYTNANSLKAECHTSYAPGAEPIQWNAKARGFDCYIQEVEELRVGFYCVD